MSAPRPTEYNTGGVTGLGLGVVVLIAAIVVYAARAGIHLVEGMVGGLLGSTTECGARLEAKGRAYRAQGMGPCSAYVRAVNEEATAPHTACPAPVGAPPASAGIYADFLRARGCAPPPARP